MHIRPATYADLQSLLVAFDYARSLMQQDGNPHQWSDGYPDEEQVLQDIQQGVAYVIEDTSAQELVGTFVLIKGEDPTYKQIDGAWLDDEMEYVTIHRIATSGKRKGIFKLLLEWCEKQYSNIRIDTHEDNHRMRYLLAESDFKVCGTIYTRNHSPRIAYQRIK